MNKSALLHMVNHVAALTDQDVEELEKLVKNFPYCQTAHLLIAKASYDKGNMLSNQKLRKAAVYATNRHLLKKLIYTSDAAVPLTIINDTNKAEKASEETNLKNAYSDKELEVVSDKIRTNVHLADVIVNPELPALVTVETAEQETSEKTALIQQSDNIVPEAKEEAVTPEWIVPETNLAIAENVEANTTAATQPDTNTLETNKLNLPVDDDTNLLVEEAKVLPSFESTNSFTTAELEELLQVEKWTPSAASSNSTNPPKNTELISENQEFNADSESTKSIAATQIIRYELEVPAEMEESALDQTLAHFDSYLFKPERDEYLHSELKPASTEEFIREVYTSNQLGYWMGSSRLGEMLQVKDDLTHHTPVQFYPDLILEYSKQNYLTPTDPPKVSPVSRQFEIIDQFLKANPKLKAFSNEKMRSEPLDDLAFKSSKNTKNLASENLANIMVQQGKIKKAIKIYEHLIVKIPEKKAYFAAQIDNLRNLI